MNTYFSIFTLSSSVLLLPLFHKKLLPLPKQLRGLVQGFCPFTLLSSCHCFTRSWCLSVTRVWFKGFCLFTLPSSCHCFKRSWCLSLNSYGGLVQRILPLYSALLLPLFDKKLTPLPNSYGGLVQRILPLYSVLLLPLFHKKLTPLPKQLRGFGSKNSASLLSPPATVSKEVDSSLYSWDGLVQRIRIASLFCSPSATVSQEVDPSP